MSPSDPMESVCRHFPPPPQLYLAIYLLSLSRTVSRRSAATRLHRIRWSPFADIFHPSSAILCCIFTKSLVNCLPMSLVAHGLLPSDSVWVYWTTLNLRKECFSNVSSRSLFRSIILGHFTVVCLVTRSLASLLLSCK